MFFLSFSFIFFLFVFYVFFFFFSSRRRHTRLVSDWSSDVCSSDLDEGPGLHVLRVATESGELCRQTILSTLRRRDGIVTTVAAQASRRSRGHAGPHLLDELRRERGDLAQVADLVVRRAVAEVPPPVLEEWAAQPEPRAERSVAVLDVLSVVTVEVEPAGQP